MSCYVVSRVWCLHALRSSSWNARFTDKDNTNILKRDAILLIHIHEYSYLRVRVGGGAVCLLPRVVSVLKKKKKVSL